MPESSTTAIIGAGFSGSLTALNILEFEPPSSAARARVVLFDRSGAHGPGLAFSTRSLVHYLNVPAGNMSAWDADPQHFVRWLLARNPAVSGSSFVSRGWYGDYLREQVDAARVRHHDRFELRPQRVTAIHCRADGLCIHDESGLVTPASRVVLALGNFPPPPPPGAHPSVLSHPGYIADPWSPTGREAVAAILPDEPLLFVGTGLTMMDLVTQLHSREHAGRMLAISRHGLLPRPHRSPARPPTGLKAPADVTSWDGSARAMLRIIRQATRAAAGRGADWRDVIASLRPITAQLWQTLSIAERQRFLARLRSYWEIVRHRAAPETGAAVADLVAARQLSVRAARIQSLAPDPAQPRLIEVRFRPRGSDNTQITRVSRVINCLGPQSDIRAIDDPLINQLRADGLITPDALGLGIAVGSNGAAIDSAGTPDTRLLVIGPFRKGQSWENTAVPELRRQAAEIARRCLRDDALSAALPAVITNPTALPTEQC